MNDCGDGVGLGNFLKTCWVETGLGINYAGMGVDH